MPLAFSRKLEFMLVKYLGDKVDVRLKQIALNQQQVEQYDIVRVPIKETELRAGRFEATHGGVGGAELDALEALHPGTLAAMVENFFEDYYSHDAARFAERQARALRQDVQEQLEAIREEYAEQFDALKAALDEMRAVKPSQRYTVEAFKAEVEETDDWLFDSSRDYFEQIQKYHAYKNGRELVEAL